MITLKESKNRHLQFTYGMVWYGHITSRSDLRAPEMLYFDFSFQKTISWNMIMIVISENRHIKFVRVLRAPAIRVSVAVSPQRVVVGSWKCFQSISHVEKLLIRQKSRENKLLSAFYRLIQEIFPRSDGRGHSACSQKYLFTSSAFFII